MPKQDKTAQERFDAFVQLPDVRFRLKNARLQIAQIEQETLLEKLDAQESEIVDLNERHERELNIALRSPSHTVPPLKPTPTIMEVWKLYKTVKITGGKWKDGENSSKREHEPHVRTFCKAIGGDKPIGEVTHEDVSTFVQFVLTEKPDESAANRKKRITRAGALFRWAKVKRTIADNFDELFKYEGAIPKNNYLKFTPEDLKALFESEDYRQNRFKCPSEYWLPLLALFTGGRENELAQLTCTDIGSHDGIKTITVLDEAGKRLKNEASRRIIPIHSKLIELGFLEYVVSIGNGRIFPELPESPEKPGDFHREPSRKFTAYRRRHGVGGDKRNPITKKWEGANRKVFHSFRSTLISALRTANPSVPLERRERIAGHESKGTQNRHYDGGDAMTMFSFSTLKEDIESAIYDVEFTPYRPAS